MGEDPPLSSVEVDIDKDVEIRASTPDEEAAAAKLMWGNHGHGVHHREWVMTLAMPSPLRG